MLHKDEIQYNNNLSNEYGQIKLNPEERTQ